jgi:DNA-directed RNA polymerase specialized sigma subunit
MSSSLDEGHTMKSWDEVTAARREDPDYRSRVDAAKRSAIAEIDEYHLAQLRRILEFTQTDVAARMGIDQARVSRVEHTTDPKLSTLRAYVEALGGTLTIVAEIPGQEPLSLAL